MRKKNREHYWQAILIYCVMAVFVLPAHASPVVRPDLYEFQIDAGTLREAVEDFRDQTDVEFLYSFELAETKGINPVYGRFTLEEALALMFRGTELSGRLTQGGMVVITPRNSAEARDQEDRMTRGKRKSSLMAGVSTFFAGLLGLSGATLAADGVAAEDTGNKQVATEMEEVVVTGLRRGEQALMDTPIAISAVSGDDIEISANTNIFDVLAREPGVNTISLNPGSNQIQIRGLSAVTGGSTVGYYLDEFPLLSGVQLSDTNPFDLKRIEILRGPQGTLYGFGSTGGTIRILTNDPDLNEFQMKVAGNWSSMLDEGGSTWALNGAVNVPIVQDKVAFRGVASHRNVGGYLDSALTGEEDINDANLDSFRGKLLVQATENFKIVGTVWINRNEVNGQSFGTEDLVALVDDESFANNSDLYNLLATLDLDNVSFLSSTTLFESDSSTVFRFPGVATLVSDAETETFVQELRFNTKFDGPLNFNGGFLYTDTDGTGNSDTTTAAVPAFMVPSVQTISDSQNSSKTWAVFGEAHLALMDGDLELTAGVRYFEDTQSISSVTETIIGGFSLGETIDPESKAEFDSISPRFNISYSVNDDLLLYANIAKGFRSGQVLPTSTLIQAGALMVELQEIKPDVLWNYEVGMKGVLLDGRLTYDVALYYFDWDDVQINIPFIPGVLSVPQNGASAKAFGVDFAFVARVTDELTLSFNGNINNAQFNGDLPSLQIEAGDQLDNSVRRSFGGDITYRRPIGSSDSLGDVTLMANLNLQQNSAREIRSFGTPGFADPITIMTARLGVEGDQWSFYLYGDNLLDERGATGGTSATFLLRLPPRSIGVNARFDF